MLAKVKIRFFLVITILFLITQYAFTAELTIHYLDVGQADSILLQLPNGENMLIDAGNNADGTIIVNYLNDQDINKIDYLIGTHPHEDHIGGLDNVIKSFNIGKIYMPKIKHTTKTFEDVLLAVKAKGKRIIAAKAGMTIIDKDNLKAYILSPVTDDYDELNNWSVVLRVDYKDTSILLTGDAEKEVEFQLLAQSSNILRNIDMLKVGHHGSNSSTSEVFLEAVSPKYAVISCGKDNDYGHPSPIVLNRLQEHNVQVYRTDLQGTIIATSDGKNITFSVDPISNGMTTDKNISYGIKITNVNLSKETVTIQNNCDVSVDLSGWKLVSVKGSQAFYFPSGTTLNPGETVIVASGKKAKSGPRVIIWTKAYIWNNDGDPAELYNGDGKLVSSY